MTALWEVRKSPVAPAHKPGRYWVAYKTTCDHGDHCWCENFRTHAAAIAYADWWARMGRRVASIKPIP